MNYWINTISRDHVMLGAEGGYTQAGHGKNTGLKRLATDDWIVFYSPQTAFKNGQPLQAFTAICQVKPGEIYQVQTAPEWHPWRRDVQSYDCAEIPIRPFIDDLSFIKDKTHWGYIFRLGLFQIPQSDFELIKRSMIEA